MSATAFDYDNRTGRSTPIAELTTDHEIFRKTDMSPDGQWERVTRIWTPYSDHPKLQRLSLSGGWCNVPVDGSMLARIADLRPRRRNGWQRFEIEDQSTHPWDDKDYVVIDEDDMMSVLAGRMNYFIRASIKAYIELPDLPDWLIEGSEK